MADVGDKWEPDLTLADMDPVQLIVVARRGRTATAGVLPLPPDVADEFRGIVHDAVERLGGMTSLPWSAQVAWERDEYRVVQRPQLEDDNAVLQALERPEHPDVGLEFVQDSQPLLYAIAVGVQPRIGEADRRLLFVRKSNPTMNLQRRLAVFWDDTLRRVDYPLLSFDRTVDLVLAPGRGLLALNGTAFELLFREAPELLERTPAYARRLAHAVRATPETEQVLVEAAQGLARVRRRVLAIVDRNHLTTVTTEQLQAELRRQGLDPATYLLNGRLSFTREQVADVLRVLNEDLLTGGLSQQRFEVERKTPLA